MLAADSICQRCVCSDTCGVGVDALHALTTTQPLAFRSFNPLFILTSLSTSRCSLMRIRSRPLHGARFVIIPPGDHVYLHPQSQVKISWRTVSSAVMRTMRNGVPSVYCTDHLPHTGGSILLITGLAYLQGWEAEGEQEQNFANQSALALYA